MPKQAVDIYTDGGADPNPGAGGWGAVLIAGLKTKEISGADPETTNNRMELTAAISALGLLKQPCQVNLYTDSQYLRKGITQWVTGWMENGWRKRNGRPVENKDLWIELIDQADRHEIEWHWVKGHRGNPLNERADRLATEARRKLPPARRRKGTPSVAIDPAALPEMVIYARACALGVPGPGGYAALLQDADGATECVSGSWPLATSNVMELWAAIGALRHLGQPSRVTVHTTSKYVLDGATKWLATWEKSGWRTVSGKPVKHREIWEELSRVLGDHDIKWLYDAKSDRGEQSDRAAQLARSEAESARDKNG